MTLPLDKLPQFAGVTADLLHPLNVLSVSWAVLYRTLRTLSPDTLIIRRNKHNHHHHHHHHQRYNYDEEQHQHHDTNFDYQASEFDEVNTNQNEQDEYSSYNYNASEDDVEHRRVEHFRPRSYSERDDVEYSQNSQSEHQVHTSYIINNKIGNANSNGTVENIDKKQLESEQMENSFAPEQVHSHTSEHRSRRKDTTLRVNDNHTPHTRSTHTLLEHSGADDNNQNKSSATEPQTPTSTTSYSHSTVVMRSTDKTFGAHHTRRSHSAEEALTSSRRVSMRERRRHKTLEPLLARSHSTSSTGLSTSSAQENSTSFTAVVSENTSENRLDAMQNNTEGNVNNLSEHIPHPQLALRSKDLNVLAPSKNTNAEIDSKKEEETSERKRKIISHRERREEEEQQQQQEEEQNSKVEQELHNDSNNDKESAIRTMEKENILITPAEKIEHTHNDNKLSTAKVVPLGKPPLSGRSRVEKLNLSNSDEYSNIKSNDNNVLTAPPPLSALHSESGLSTNTSTLSNSTHHNTVISAHNQKSENATHLSRSSMRSPRHRSSRSRDSFVSDDNSISQDDSVSLNKSEHSAYNSARHRHNEELGGITDGGSSRSNNNNNRKLISSHKGIDGKKLSESEILEHRYNRKRKEKEQEEEEEKLVGHRRFNVHNTYKSIYDRFMRRDMRQEAKLITHILRAVPVSMLHFICSVQRQMAALPLMAFDDISPRLRTSTTNTSNSKPDNNFLLNSTSELQKESVENQRMSLAGVMPTIQYLTQHANDHTHINENVITANTVNTDVINDQTNNVFASFWSQESFLESASSSSSSSSSMIVHFLILRVILQLLCNYVEKAFFLDDSLAVRQLRSRSFGRRCAGWILRLSSHTLLDPILLSVITPMLCLVNETPEQVIGSHQANTSVHSKINIAAAGRQSNTLPDDHIRSNGVWQSDLERSAGNKGVTLQKESTSKFVFKPRISVPGVLHALVNGATSVLLQYLVTPFATMLCDRACVTVCEGFEYWFMRRYTVWPSEDESDEESEEEEYDEDDVNDEDDDDDVENHKNYLDKQRNEIQKGTSLTTPNPNKASKLHHDISNNDNKINESKQSIMPEERNHQLSEEHKNQHNHNSVHLIKDHVEASSIPEETEAKHSYKMTTQEEREQRRQAKKLRQVKRAERQAAADASAHACILRAIFYRVGSSLFAQCVIEHPLSVLVEVAKGRAVMHLAGMLASYDTLPQSAFGVQWHSIVSYAQSLIKRAETTLSSDEVSERRILPYVMALLSISGMALSHEMYMLLSCIKKISGQQNRVAELRSASWQSTSQSALAASMELIMRTIMSYTPLFNAVEYTVIDKGVSFYMAVYTRLRRQVSSSV